MRMSVATSEGENVWAFRYSSDGVPPSLFYSTDVQALRRQHPEIEVFQTLSDESRLVVSEPLGELAGVWNEIPPSSWGMICAGRDEIGTFIPAAN
jgi:glutamine amidotransferase